MDRTYLLKVLEEETSRQFSHLHATAAGFYRRLGELGWAPATTRKSADKRTELAEQISALNLRSTAWNEVAPERARKRLGPQRYLISVHRRQMLMRFLGSAIEERVFVPECFWAERELLEAVLEVVPVESQTGVVPRRRDLAGLCALVLRVDRAEHILVALALG